MFENRIKELRRAKGVTQRQLAEAAKTSQQQIQRIEAGNQHARFDLATRISAALGQPISRVFPSAALPLARLKTRANASEDDDEKTDEELAKAGLDMEPDVWTVKYKLRGEAEGQFSISGPDMHRLNAIFQTQGDDGFVVLPSTDRQYALNLKHLIFCHLLFDRPPHEMLLDRLSHEELDRLSHEEVAEKDKSFEVEFYLSGQREPLRFDVEPDTSSLDDEEDPDPLSVQLQDLFYYAELGTNGRRLKFVDIDGETAFFRPDDVSMFSVPLWLIEPNVSAEEEDEETGGSHAG